MVVGKRKIQEPRLTAFLGARDGLQYTYSQKLNVSTRWPQEVEDIKKRIEGMVGHHYNVVLMNWSVLTAKTGPC